MSKETFAYVKVRITRKNRDRMGGHGVGHGRYNVYDSKIRKSKLRTQHNKITREAIDSFYSDLTEDQMEARLLEEMMEIMEELHPYPDYRNDFEDWLDEEPENEPEYNDPWGLYDPYDDLYDDPYYDTDHMGSYGNHPTSGMSRASAYDRIVSSSDAGKSLGEILDEISKTRSTY